MCTFWGAVLQFVPSHVDVRVCSFSERVERGLLMAYAEVCRRSQENGNFTVHVCQIYDNDFDHFKDPINVSNACLLVCESEC